MSEEQTLGAFSMSLAVKDLSASKAFYETLGFTTMGGDAEQGWLILRNGKTTLGLFQGMFDENMLTFNPGWSQDAEALEDFEDIRDLQKRLTEAGCEVHDPADLTSEGPASFIVIDPDGNPILIDQHVGKPA
jgi:lactoylglutathione lyase